MLDLERRKYILSLELVDISFHDDEASAEDLDQEFSDRGRFLEVVAVVG